MNNETKELIDSIDRMDVNQAENVFNKQSHLWETILQDRSEVYTDETFESLLKPETGQSSGTSDWKRDISDELIKYFESFISPSMIKRFPMPRTGSPITFKLFGEDASTPYLWNLSTFSICKDLVQPLLPKGGADIVEIGAGYGAAALMWVQSGAVQSYTIIDLKENLVNSAFYLSDNLPGWNINVCLDCLPEIQPKTINLVVPGCIENIDSLTFDFALNSDSLGEMPAETAVAYVDWIHRHLKPTGVFFSKNGHRRGVSHIERVSDYGYQKFSLINFKPSYICSSLFDDFSHIILLKKSGRPWAGKQVEYIDTLSNIFSVGLQQDMRDICEQFTQNNLGFEEERFLEESKKFFNGQTNLEVDGLYSHLLKYFIALRQAAEEKRYKKGLEEYMTIGKSYVAKVYCLLCLSYYKKRLDSTAESDPGFNIYIKEIISFEKRGYLDRKLRYLIRLENIRKKTTPYKKWKPSLIIKIKNLAFNLIEGRPVNSAR
ncbi:putative sugar O-methyltransferase [bacterium]|nr:putative sugar O-methyltransferase [bacterium]